MWDRTLPGTRQRTGENQLGQQDGRSPAKRVQTAASNLRSGTSGNATTNAKLDATKFSPLNHEYNMVHFLPAKVECLEYTTGDFTWEIANLKQEVLSSSGKTMSDSIAIGGLHFKLVLTHDGEKSISVYLEAQPLEGETLGDDWCQAISFGIIAWDPESYNYHSSKTNHSFNRRVVDWGFARFIDMNSSLGSSFLSKNRLNLTAYVRVYDDYTNVLFNDLLRYDSKKSTGYVGIENQGATCYLNSLLQSYFFTLNFKEKVYQIPTEDEIKMDLGNYQLYKSQSKSVPLSLQRIFYKLETSKQAIESLELTQSFGWTTADAFEQHDVQELNRILMDKLENKMKGTEIDGCFNDIFVGKMKSFIRCLNVDYESSRVEDFWDIQLNVKSLKGIKESFENYIDLELLDGDNKYDAGEFGLQDAEKGVIFESFPPVLHIQLKRYEYDFNIDQMTKINDRYEFDQSIDLKPYLSKSAENYDENWEYELHGVLVHQGDVSMGHYYAMIKPSLEDKWFRFEDDRVVRVTPYQVFEENFGSNNYQKNPFDGKGLTREEAMNLFWKNSTSAYMLVYIRKDKLKEILIPNENIKVPEYIKRQIEYENEEELKLKKEREEMHLYVNIHIVTDSRFQKYSGFDICPNKSNQINYSPTFYDKDSFSLKLKVLKTESIDKLFELIAHNEYPPNEINDSKLRDIRLWKMDFRTNDTFRVTLPISCRYKERSESCVGDICKIIERQRYKGYQGPTDIYLYAEDLSMDLNYIFDCKLSLLKNHQQPKDSEDDYQEKIRSISKISRDTYPTLWESFSDNKNILVFIKYFDYSDQCIKGLGHMILRNDTTLDLVSKKISTILDLPNNSEVSYIEELSPEEILKRSQKSKLYEIEIQNGDIFCFNIPKVHDGNMKVGNMLQCYEFMATRRHFKIIRNLEVDENEMDFVDPKDSPSTPEENEKSNELDFWLSYKSTYADVANEIGEIIGRNPNKLKLFYIDQNGDKFPLKSNINFRELASIEQTKSCTLSYEILTIPLKELEELKECSVYWVGNGICKYEKHEFSVPRSSTLDNIIDKLETKVQFTNEQRDDLIIWTFTDRLRFEQLCQSDYTIETNESFVVGYYPDYLKVLTEGSDKEMLITGFHFFQSVENYHSLPFIFKLIKNESLNDMCIRLRKLLGLSEKEFKIVHIGVAHDSNIEYLDLRKPLDAFGIFEEGYAMALNHPDRNARRGSTQSSIYIKG